MNKNGLFINAQGDSEWYVNNKLHRLEGPAIIDSKGNQYWFKEGRLHREDGPAVEKIDGTQRYYMNGVEKKLSHSVTTTKTAKKTKKIKTVDETYEKKVDITLNGTMINEKGDSHTYVNGLLHSKNTPAVIYANGDKHWFKKGKLHRLEGPAIEEANGNNYWFKEGRLFRENGPAIERKSEQKWYIKGKPINQVDGEKRFLEKIVESKPSTKKIKI